MFCGLFGNKASYTISQFPPEYHNSTKPNPGKIAIITRTPIENLETSSSQPTPQNVVATQVNSPNPPPDIVDNGQAVVEITQEPNRIPHSPPPKINKRKKSGNRAPKVSPIQEKKPEPYQSPKIGVKEPSTSVEIRKESINEESTSIDGAEIVSTSEQLMINENAKGMESDDEMPMEGNERRPGVIPLPIKYDENESEPITKHPKDPADAKLIKAALEKNEFLARILKDDILKEVVDAMYNREIKSKEVIIKEGEKGSHMYVSAKGKYEISVKGKGVVSTFADVRVFGELAILYNDKRMATIKAVKPGRVWVLNRSVYQQLMVRANIKEEDEMLSFLQKVPILNTVGYETLQKVASLLEVEFFPPGTQIVKEGDRGDKFYIVRAGTVTITKEDEGILGQIKTGEYFGELALLKEDTRQATVIADPPGVECLTLKRQPFIDHFGEVDDISSITIRGVTSPQVSLTQEPSTEHDDIDLSELRIVKTLGVGGFGRVELVQHKNDPKLVFALKYLKKIDMVEQNQQEHVYNEKNIQMSCKSMFIIRLYRTFRDSKYIYFLMESCLGGDVWTLLQRQHNRRFDEKEARFIAACVLESFAYLHQRGIVYRDLKPENLLVDKDGYIKLTDFGFAKKLGPRGRTYTFAGTPEYVAPEIVLNRGHDKAVDYWAFGIFIFELLTGKTPFRTNDSSHMRTYNKILSGIDSVDFPPTMSHKARHIIEKLCRPLPTERLGCQRNGVKDVKNNRWFMGFDWVKLNERKLPVIFKPKLKSATDTQYFESFKRDDENPPDEVSGWDKDF